jgi:hypothetical protein
MRQNPRRRMQVLPAAAIGLVAGTAWFLVVRHSERMIILTAPIYLILTIAFGVWAAGKEVVTGWPREKNGKDPGDAPQEKRERETGR